MSVEAATWVFMYSLAGARASKAVQRPTATLDISADVQGKFPPLTQKLFLALPNGRASVALYQDS
jgi:hypothetical protein